MIAIAAVGALTACATTHPKLSVTKYGAADPDGERQIIEDYEELSDDHADITADDVLVLVETVPEGITVESGMLSVEDGYDHEIIARFEMQPSQLAGPWWFYDYRAGWRKAFCYPQVPLTWITITAWSTLAPPAWTCWGSSKTDKATFIRDARRLARAAGGDTAVITFLLLRGSDAEGAEGVILRLDPNLDPDDLDKRPWRPSRQEDEEG